jgi:hypothetical protein
MKPDGPIFLSGFASPDQFQALPELKLPISGVIDQLPHQLSSDLSSFPYTFF